MIFYLNLILIFLLFFWEVRNTFKKGYFISIQIILTFCTIVFILLTPLILQFSLIEDNNFNLILLFGIIGVFIAGRVTPYDLIDPNKFKNKLFTPKYKVSKKWSYFGFIIFLSYLIILIILEIIKYGSFTAIFSSDRLNSIENSSIGSLLYIVMLFFRILFYIHIYDFFLKRKNIKFIFFYFIPIIHHQITAITRFDFLIMILVLIFLYIEPILLKNNTKNNLKKISSFKLGLIIIPVVFFSLFYMYVANIVRHGGLDRSSDIINIQGLSNSNFATDLNYYLLLNSLYDAKEKNKIDFEYGKSWFFYPLLTYIPKAVWPEKPPTAFSTRYTEKLFWKLGDGPVATFTIYGEGYIQFGLFGAFFAPILFAYSRYLSLSYLKNIINSRLIILLILFSMITYFRAEQPIVFVLLEFIYGFIIMKFFSKKVAN